MFPKSVFSLECGCVSTRARASAKRLPPPFKWKKAFWKHFESENSFCKKSRNYFESGLVSAFNGWTSQKMHEILLCLKFEAVVDVIWKSFLVCLITWMLNFSQIKYFDACERKIFPGWKISVPFELKFIFSKLGGEVVSFRFVSKASKLLMSSGQRKSWNFRNRNDLIMTLNFADGNILQKLNRELYSSYLKRLAIFWKFSSKSL